MRLYPIFPQIPNTDSLTRELNQALGISSAGCGFEGAGNYFVEVPDNITLQQVQTVVDAHNPGSLTTEQQKAVARTIMLSQAKNYFSEQLATANPNVTNIYDTVRNYVNNNPVLLQMVTNQIALAQTAWGWAINQATPTPADRIRYLVCCQLVIATIA